MGFGDTTFLRQTPFEPNEAVDAPGTQCTQATPCERGDSRFWQEPMGTHKCIPKKFNYINIYIYICLCMYIYIYIDR